MFSLSGKMGTMSESAGPETFGRVDEDGTVFVRTPDGERAVGQVPDVDKHEALAFFVRRFEALRTEVNLLSQRIGAGSLSPEEARKSINAAKDNVVGANAVGDLAGLEAQLDALAPAIAAQQEARKAQRAEQTEQALAAKSDLVAQAEQIAEGSDWRNGMSRFNSLLDEWKKLPHFDKHADNQLWQRFSAARTTYTRRRKAHYAQDSARRDQAKATKERIIERTRELVTSTEWGPTAAELRDLMSQWKAAGSAQREVDDQLWAQFRGLQDQFYAARSAVFDEQDAEYRANQQAKEALLDEAERTLLPVTDAKAARVGFRDFLAKYNEYGKVPRDAIRKLDGRLRALEDAVKEAEESEWHRSDPQARQRALDTVNMFTEKIDKYHREIEQAKAKGDQRKIKKLQESIDAYTQWRAAAQKNLDEFDA